MRKLLLPALLLPALGSSAQQVAVRPPKPAKPAAISTGTLTGHVICADTRRPARGAMVMLEPLTDVPDPVAGMNGRMARTDMNGSYRIDRVPVGTYSVVALLPGYISPMDGLDESTDGDPGMPERIRAKLASLPSVSVWENTTGTGDVTLERGATLAGRVLFPDGSPATQVSILVESTFRSEAARAANNSMDLGTMVRSMFNHQSIGTDDQGHFRISGIQPGSYRVAAVPAASISDGREAEMAMISMMGVLDQPQNLKVYAGNTLHRKDARVFELRGSDEVADLEITLPIDSFHRVSGRVTALDGRALNEGNVKLTDSADPGLSFGATLDTDGTFHLASVPTGTYTLSASDGRIMKPNPEIATPGDALRAGTPVAAFAEGSTSVLVKDSDLSDVLLALKETALPKLPPATSTPGGDPDEE